MIKVSVIIPTYNRFKYLLNAIESVLNQTHKDIEVIVVNDCSREEEYYSFDFKAKFGDNVRIIHLDKNTKKMFGHASAGYCRTVGCKEANGEYIAFLDDDDIWFPVKLEKQLLAMRENNCEMSSTEGLIGNKNEIYNINSKYQMYNSDKHFKCLKNIYSKQNIDLTNGFPKIWDKKFINIHNCMITSSVIVKKDILEKINYMKYLRNGKEDYDCWKRCLEYTDSIYLEDDVYFFYASVADHNNRFEYN
tara:strand:- start:560 stop:1303 length:744 start_codon:yes stop_codon:yes gene_type:complete